MSLKLCAPVLLALGVVVHVLIDPPFGPVEATAAVAPPHLPPAPAAAPPPAEARARPMPAGPADLEQQLDPLTFVLAATTGEEEAARRSGAADRHTRLVAVEKGDTLGALLQRAEVPADDAHQAIEALRSHYDPRQLRPGQEIALHFDSGRPDPFIGLTLQPDVVQTVSVSRSAGAGGFTAAAETAEVRTEILGAAGTINASLYVDGTRAGIPMPVMMGLVRIFSYDVDFQRDLQPGDGFRVLFERQVTETGETAGHGAVLQASLSLSGKQITLTRFESADGTVDWYTPDGKSVRKALLQTPIDGVRISSGFGMRRHPILGYSRMHKGIDFAAPSGTPIYAAGDGVIEKLERQRGYGNYIRIRHNGEISTAYAHLSRFAKGLRGGSKVQQGDVIGYVGSTGMSTGPHLHYEVLVKGTQVNPKSMKMPTGRHLEGRDLARFRQEQDRLAQEWRRQGGVLLVTARAQPM